MRLTSDERESNEWIAEPRLAGSLISGDVHWLPHAPPCSVGPSLAWRQRRLALSPQSSSLHLPPFIHHHPGITSIHTTIARSLQPSDSFSFRGLLRLDAFHYPEETQAFSLPWAMCLTRGSTWVTSRAMVRSINSPLSPDDAGPAPAMAIVCTRPRIAPLHN